MNKNMILLIGIILIFLLIIRPTGKTASSENGGTDLGADTENEDLENKLTEAENNHYVEQSKANNANTEQEVIGSNVTK